MSQSDYIKYKKTGVQLKTLSKQPSVLTPKTYTAYMNYNLENTIPNTKITYNRLIPANRQIVFGAERSVTSCPTFAVCGGTNTRANRRPLLAWQAHPTPRPKYVKDPMNYRAKYGMKCVCKNVKCVCTAQCNTCFNTPIIAPKPCAI
jgi:hypothetical protein